MALTKVTSGMVNPDPSDAANLSSGSVPAARLGNVDTSGLEDDIALLGFKVASNGSLAKYNLVDQTVDDFQDTSGVDAGSSTNEIRNASGKYYSGAAAATGGTQTQVTIGPTTYDLFTFTEDGTLTPGAAANVDILVVGGGGAGGQNIGGGGGAGGLVYKPAQAIAASAYGITIGAGGVTTGDSGSDTVFDTAGVTNTLTAKGGGFGGGHAGSGSGAVGGSGGADGGGSGSAAAANQTSQPGDSGTYGFGNAGAEGVGSPYAGGGGGGAGGAGVAGVNSPSQKGGDGGVGKDYSGTFGTGVGASGWFAGGGGGSVEPAAPVGAGGTGGGGAGGQFPNTVPGGTNGVAGTANTGGGGGGASSPGASGGSGVVIIRSAESALSTFNNMTLVSTTTAAKTGLVPSKGDIVLTYTNGAGTTTLDTDLTAEISADGGSTWTDLPLASEGSTGSHNIATSHDITIDSTITDPYNMAYRIKTLNQSVSKTTRIQAVSLGWS